MSATQSTVGWYELDPVDLAARRTRTSGKNTVRFLRVIVNSTQPAREPLIDALDTRLEELSDYPEGWDGGDSAAPSELAIGNARQFLQEAFRSAIRATEQRSASSEWRRPHISASEDGQIVFEWWNGDRKLTLYFGDEPDSASFIRSWGPHVINEMEDGPFSPEDFGAHWAWLFG